MTKEEAKRRADIMLAYAKGETIEFLDSMNGTWIQLDNPSFNFEACEYRVVNNETNYRPFKNAAEAFSEAKKHGFWFKQGGAYRYITDIDKDIICTLQRYTFSRFSEFIWADDGTPCGVKE